MHGVEPGGAEESSEKAPRRFMSTTFSLRLSGGEGANDLTFHLIVRGPLSITGAVSSEIPKPDLRYLNRVEVRTESGTHAT